MERHQLSEHEAYQKLRRMAMAKNLKLAELAQRIGDVAELLQLANDCCGSPLSGAPINSNNKQH